MSEDVTRPPSSAEIAGSRRAQLGEGPYWDAPRDRAAVGRHRGRPRPRRTTPPTVSTQVLLDHDDLVSAVLPHADGDLVLGCVTASVGGTSTMRRPPRLVLPLQADDPDVRCNDASVGPDGVLWIGTMQIGRSVASVAGPLPRRRSDTGAG
jgi:xylono-1,5-lactonase